MSYHIMAKSDIVINMFYAMRELSLTLMPMWRELSSPLLTLMWMWRELSSARWWSSRESKPTVDRRAAAAPTSVSIHSCEQVNWEHKC